MADIRTTTITLVSPVPSVAVWRAGNGITWAQLPSGQVSISTGWPASSVAWGDPSHNITNNPSSPLVNSGLIYPAGGGIFAVTVTWATQGPPDFEPPETNIPDTCIRRAWLTLGDPDAPSQSIELHSPNNGWVCTSLDLGYPTVREVINNRPDQDGIDDRTRLFGARAVSAGIVILKSWGARIDERADDFAPFMLPSLRPVLHWILDRGANPERRMIVRAAEYQWAVETDYERDVHLAWVASDPVAYGAVVNQRTAWAGSSGAQGRTYNLTFPRTYPSGGGTGGFVLLTSDGDLPFYPLYRIYGPITWPRIQVNVHDASIGTGITSFININFLQSFSINAGEWVDIDSANKTAFRNSNPQLSVQSQIDWNTSRWGGIPPNPSNGSMGLYGSSTSGVTQVTAFWRDGYIS